MQVENTEIGFRMSEPIQQLGTPWVENAADRMVEIIFWLCVVQLVFGVLSGLNSCRGTAYSELSQDEETGGKIEIEVETESNNNHFLNFLIILIPILGILAIKLDCLEVLKAFAVITVICVLGLCCFIILSFLLIGNAIREREDVLWMVIFSLILITITALQIAGIAFAWRYAFPGDDAENAIKKIITFGGNGDGATCHFPFVYKGETYDECTKVGSFPSKLWCATTENYDDDKLWGKCPVIKEVKDVEPKINFNDMEWEVSVKTSG